MQVELGYNKPLYILAFDHRSSFVKMFGFKTSLTPDQTKIIADAKRVIYQGFKQAVAGGLPKDAAAVLVDEQFGDAVLRDAKADGYIICLATEKSGQEEFDFEYGKEFRSHIEKYKPSFVKVLVHYNPEGDQVLNARQRAKLEILSDYCHQKNYKFLIEPLVPATKQQLDYAKGDLSRYDRELRPRLTLDLISQLQECGVEPDIWKIEGLEFASQYEAAVTQARAGGRDEVGIIVLGRGADKLQVQTWLMAARGVDGVKGFAIGRTIFWEPLEKLRDKKITQEQAIEEIGKNYLEFYKIFIRD